VGKCTEMGSCHRVGGRCATDPGTVNTLSEYGWIRRSIDILKERGLELGSESLEKQTP